MLVTDHKAMPSILWPYITISGLFSIPVWPFQHSRHQYKHSPNKSLMAVILHIPVSPVFYSEFKRRYQQTHSRQSCWWWQRWWLERKRAITLTQTVMMVPIVQVTSVRCQEVGRMWNMMDMYICFLSKRWRYGFVYAMRAYGGVGGWRYSSTHSSPWR